MKKHGNAIVGQSGGPTAAINATLSGVIREAMREGSAIERLFGMKNGLEGLMREDLIDLSSLFDSEEKLAILEQTPAAVLGSCRKKLPKLGENDTEYERLIEIFKKYNIRYFFYIGGNDSMDTVAKLSAYTVECGYQMAVMGIPKTIDNDLFGTDHTPGFGSAAKYVAVTTQEIIRDCAVYQRPAVTLIEIMGRDAGWLTAASAVGRFINGIEPDYVYLPERAFDLQRFFSDVRSALSRHPNVVIAVSEGLRFADGSYVGASKQNGTADAFGHIYLAGVGKALEFAIKEEIGCKVRSIELSLPQRCSAHLASATDLRESVWIAQEAVRAAEAGITGKMMTFTRISAAPYRVTVDYVDVSQSANRNRCIWENFISETGNHVTDDCCRYIEPLIQGEVSCQYQNGLPIHFII